MKALSVRRDRGGGTRRLIINGVVESTYYHTLMLPMGRVARKQNHRSAIGSRDRPVISCSLWPGPFVVISRWRGKLRTVSPAAFSLSRQTETRSEVAEP